MFHAGVAVGVYFSSGQGMFEFGVEFIYMILNASNELMHIEVYAVKCKLAPHVTLSEYVHWNKMLHILSKRYL